MRRIIPLIIVMLILAVGLSATITYSTVTTQTVNRFAVMSGTTTVAVADTAANYILSPTFSAGYSISNKGIMINGVITTALKHTVSTAVGKVLAVLQVSADGTNYVDFASYNAYMSTGATAGTVITVPVSLVGIQAPYYRVKWVGYSATGVIYTADIFGAIKTQILVPPN